MSWLKSISKVPDKYEGAYLKLLVERIRTAVNFLDESNFPNGIGGSWIQDGTVTPKKMLATYWHIPIVASAEGVFIVTTDPTSVGGYIAWPGALGANVKLQLYATVTSSNPSATATITLEGTEGTLVTITSNLGTWELKQSDKFDAPTSSQTLVLKVSTSSGSYSAGILNAVLVATPNN